MPKFTNARKFNKNNIKSIPNDKPIIYRLQNNKKQKLYTGIAKKGRIPERLFEHINLKKERIPGATKIKIVQMPNVEKAKIIEKRLMKKFQPRFNIQNKE